MARKVRGKAKAKTEPKQVEDVTKAEDLNKAEDLKPADNLSRAGDPTEADNLNKAENPKAADDLNQADNINQAAEIKQGTPEDSAAAPHQSPEDKPASTSLTKPSPSAPEHVIQGNSDFADSTGDQYPYDYNNHYTRVPLSERQLREQCHTLYGKNSSRFQEAWCTLHSNPDVPAWFKTDQAEEMVKHVATVNPLSLRPKMTAQELMELPYLSTLSPYFKLPDEHPFANHQRRPQIGTPDLGLNARSLTYLTRAIGPIQQGYAQSNIFSTPPGYNDPFGGTNSGYSMGAVFDGRGGSGLLASRNYQPGPFYNTRHSSGSLGSGAFHTKLAGQQSSTEVGGNPNSQQSGQQKLTSESSSESNDLSDDSDYEPPRREKYRRRTRC